MKLLALTVRMLGMDDENNGFTLPSSLPSPKMGNNDEVTLLRQNVEKLTALVAQLVQSDSERKLVQYTIPIY